MSRDLGSKRRARQRSQQRRVSPGSVVDPLQVNSRSQIELNVGQGLENRLGALSLSTLSSAIVRYTATTLQHDTDQTLWWQNEATRLAPSSVSSTDSQVTVLDDSVRLPRGVWKYTAHVEFAINTNTGAPAADTAEIDAALTTHVDGSSSELIDRLAYRFLVEEDANPGSIYAHGVIMGHLEVSIPTSVVLRVAQVQTTDLGGGVSTANTYLDLTRLGA